jgi:hypothetical protein
MKCVEVVLTGMRCPQEVTGPSPISGTTNRCYYHGKVFDGLCDPYDAIAALNEDDE